MYTLFVRNQVVTSKTSHPPVHGAFLELQLIHYHQNFM